MYVILCFLLYNHTPSNGTLLLGCVCVRLRKVRESVARDSSTGDHTSDGNHRKTSVLKFGKLHFVLLFLRDGVKTHGIKPKVTRSTIVLAKTGKSRHGDSLQEGNPSKDLNHGIRKSIMSLNDVGDALEGELLTRDTHEFGNDESNGGKHSSTAMLQFSLTEPGKPLRSTLSETSRVPFLGGELGREGDRFGTFTSYHTISESTGSSFGLGNLSGSKGRSRSGNSSGKKKELGHGRWGCLDL
mmetsp:Transcript_13158/g.20521  ORF Transcript_13158/g.20521 Transcript_13158/m.20521 type:complete len:242 (+) Transcript_13158:327-1052(+)